MASFNGNIGTPTNGFNLKVEYSYTQDISTNTTTITSITGYCKKNNASYYSYNTNKLATIKIERLDDNGNWVIVNPISSSKQYTLENTSAYNFNGVSTSTYLTFVSGTNISIPHKTDGTQQIRITFNVDGKLSSYYPYGNISSTDTLTTIPRASSITATNADIESNSVITINKTSNNFKHTLTYSFGGLTGTIATKTTASSVNFAIPSSFYAKIPNAKSGTCTITCTTYNGNTAIGTKTTTITVSCNENLCKPDITLTVVDTNPDTIALTGDSSKVIKGYSIVKTVVNATPKNGSSIISKTINNLPTTGELSFVVTISGLFIAVVKDSRGFESTEIISLPCVWYNAPTCSAVPKRQSQTSNTVNLNISGNYFNESFGATSNTLTLSWQYREKGTSQWLPNNPNPITPTINDNTYSANVNCGNLFDYRKNYEFIVYFNDELNQLNTGSILLLKGIFNFALFKNCVMANGKVLFYW